MQDSRIGITDVAGPGIIPNAVILLVHWHKFLMKQ